MKRIYASVILAAVLLCTAYYSSWRVKSFADEISSSLAAAAEAMADENTTAARIALQNGAELCTELRTQMYPFLRTEEFAELEASMNAADGYLEQDAPEEALGEVRRAQVSVRNLRWLAQRLL